MIWTWLIIVVFLAFIEIITTSLTTIWFVASGLISLVISVFTDNFFIQFAVFVVLGILLMITTRRYLVKLVNSKKERTNLDRIIGYHGVVLKEIDKNHPGEVKVDGKCWTAISDKKISVNKSVKVLLIDGVKIKVEEDI